MLKKTSELAVGDVIFAHGMRVLVDSPPSEAGNRAGTFSTRGRVLNLDEVLCRRQVPASFIRDGRWTVQGNDLARWHVEPGPGWIATTGLATRGAEGGRS